jgi:tetratricopeptide (TPR) repeat protein
MLRRQNKNTSSRFVTSPGSRDRAWPGRLFLLIVLVVIGTLFWQRQTISDWIQLYGYQPPARIAALATQTTMTDTAEHLFYLNKPLIAGKADFSSHCKEIEKTIVLGCYHGGQDGIFILQIADSSELHGVMQVTAAHEMLHAAYDRLSNDDKKKLDTQLQAYYDTGLKDKAIKKEVDAYRTSEPGELLNEMHSIFGTEVANLPSGLENYYNRYFGNRMAVVKQAEQYQGAFRSREAAVKAYDAQLTDLQQTITTNEAVLKAKAAELQRLRKQLDSYKSAGKISQYNAAVPTYNSLVRSYNSLLATTRRQITTYNVIVQKRNALVLEERQLVQQLSGSDLPSVQ